MCKTEQSESEIIIVDIEDICVNFQTEPVFIEEENALPSETYRQSINIAEEFVTIETEDFHVKFQTKPYDKEFWQRISIYQLIYSLSGLVLGLVCMILGNEKIVLISIFNVGNETCIKVTQSFYESVKTSYYLHL